MVLRGMDSGTARRAQYHGAGQASARAMPQAGGMVDDLVHRRVNESGKLDFCDRLQTLRRHSDCQSRDQALSKRSVEHSLRAKTREQTHGRTEHSAVHPYVFAKDDDVWIALHFAGK